MKKKQLFRILNFAERDEVINFGKRLESLYDVATLKKPQKTLCLLKVRESARNSLFYAGESLTCECIVALEGKNGFAAALGDDLEKVYAMAIIDAAMNSDIPEKEALSTLLLKWDNTIQKKHATDAKVVMSTKVNFSVMEED